MTSIESINENDLGVEIDVVEMAEMVDLDQPSTNAFAELGIDPILVSTLEKAGLVTPTPIQQQAIPVLMRGTDVIASAPTGTGKTAAFLLPCLTALATAVVGVAKGPRILVLTPTRELAQQVSKAAFELSAGMPRVKTVCITGGESYPEQLRKLSRPYEILVATPGRLLDHFEKGRIDFSRVTTFILDEADRMLDMGFSDDVLDIAEMLPIERQTVCFTATISKNVRSIASQLLNNPKIIELANNTIQHDCIDHQVIFADDLSHKRKLLSHCLVDDALGQAIIFTATKRDAESLAEDLEADGHSAVALHGDLKQSKRTQMLNKLRRGEAKVLVATDVAARGLDVPAITHVFNFDLPRNAEDYVHRIGRTGRAGASGVALSFVSSSDIESLRRIERFISQKVKVKAIEGLEARFKPGERSSNSRGPKRSFSDNNRRPSWGSRDSRDGGDRSDSRGDSRPSRPYSQDRAPVSSGGFSDRSDRPASDRPARPFSDRAERPSFSADRGRPPFSADNSRRPAREGSRDGYRDGGQRTYSSSPRPPFEKRNDDGRPSSPPRFRGRP